MRSLFPTALLFAAVVLAAPFAQAQVCEGNVTLTTQAEVDAYNCSVVNGFLRIAGSDITNLDGFSGLTLAGALWVTYNDALESIAGLMNLTSVDDFGGLQIVGNPALESLAGLENLTSVVHDISIADNDALESLTGLENLTSVDEHHHRA